MNSIKLWFSDFYKGFNPYENSLLDLLNPYFEFQIGPESPDVLIYSCHGKEFLSFDTTRIFYTGENLVPDFNLCDYAIGFHHLQFGERYLRFPNYAFLQDQFTKLQNRKNLGYDDLKRKRYFCNYIFANNKADPSREQFFHSLSEYKQVSSPGKHLQNMNFDVGERFSSDWMYTKLNFQSSCKFTIAFENTSTPGYTTEKIMHAFISNTIPIYWGDPEVAKDFNPDAFINCHSFKNFQEVISFVKEVDKNDELYLQIANSPAFKNDEVPAHLKTENIVEFFRNILKKSTTGRVQRPRFGTSKNYEMELKEGQRKPYSSLERKLRKFKF